MNKLIIIASILCVIVPVVFILIMCKLINTDLAYIKMLEEQTELIIKIKECGIDG